MRERIVLLIIVALGVFLRLYHLPETMMFRGDQGRDAIVAKRILKDRDIALIGPVTSVGNMYLGPFYYYFMVPFLALTYPNPVGPAYGVAALNIAAIVLLYVVAKKYFDSATALIGAGIFATMPYAVQYSRFSWNPNIGPFFAVLLLWSMLSWWNKRSLKQAALMGLWVGILAQSHYVSLICLGLVGLIYAVDFFYQKKYISTLLHGLVTLVVFVFTQLPLIIFDFRHDHLISQSFMAFLTSPEKHMEVSSFGDRFSVLVGRANLVLSQLLQVSNNERLSWVFMIFAILLAIYALFRVRDNAFMLVGSWVLITIIGISFYSHSVFPHYLTFLYPILALFWAYLIRSLCTKKITFSIGILLLGLLGWFSVRGLRTLSWNGLGTSVPQAVANELLPYVKTPYNITLLSDDKDYKGMVYRYFLEVSDKRPKEPDDYGDLTSLAIIDEVNTVAPRSVPIYEIQSAKDFVLTHTLRSESVPHILVLERE